MITKYIVTYKGYASSGCTTCTGKYQFKNLIHYWLWYLKKTVKVFKKQTVIYE